MLNDIYQSLSPIALDIGIYQIRWYGIAYIAGFLFAGLIIWSYARHWRLKFGSYDVLVFICYCAFGIIIGARFCYCLFYGAGYYLENPLKIVAIGEGGMSFHGGLIGVFIAGFIYSRVYKMPLMTLADLVACAAPAGLFFGRLANFVNGELYGARTDVAWGVDFTGTGVMYHPSQLYEAFLEGIVIFVVLFVLSRRCDPPRARGSFIGCFLILYGCFRILIEFVRLPDAQIGYLFGTWGTMGQLLSVPMVLFGVILLIYAAKRHLPQEGFACQADPDSFSKQP